MKRILIIRLSSFGDILLTTPALRCIRNKYPDAHIDFLTRTPYVSLVAGNPYVNSVIRLDAKTISELAAVRNKIKAGYDYIVDFHNNWRTRFLTVFSGAKVFRTNRYDFRRRLFVVCGVNMLANVPPVPLRHVESVRQIGVVDDGGSLFFRATPDAVMSAKNLLVSKHLHDGFIALSPGSRWATKEWLLERYAELITLMPNEKFVIFGGNQDKGAGAKLVAVDPLRVVNICGETSPAVAGEVLRHAKVLVSNDSGLMHMATAVAIPVVAIFGCTVREFGFFPFRANSRVVEKSLSCRPCATKGREKCPEGTLECLRSIEAEEVADAIKELLSAKETL